MIIALVALVIGFACLWKGGDFLVDGSSKLAAKYNVPEFIIGLTLVAFGTSAPELIVNAIASFEGKIDLVYGNVLGSNIANLLLIFGVSGLIVQFKITDKHLFKNLWVSFIALVVFVGCLFLPLGSVASSSSFLGSLNLNFIKSCIMFAFFIFYMIYLLTTAPRYSEPSLTDGSVYSMVALFIGGLFGLLLGAKIVVFAITSLSHILGLSETFLSLFLLAIGTSLPELFASVISVKKGQINLAFGNIIGSNIFNILLVLPVSGMITILPFSSSLLIEVGIISCATLAIPLVLFLTKKTVIPRLFSLSYLVSYVVYIVVIACYR